MRDSLVFTKKETKKQVDETKVVMKEQLVHAKGQ
jgi:hypothetical protein